MSKSEITVDHRTWYNTRSAAEYLGLKPMTLYNYAHHNTGPAREERETKAGHRVYYNKGALDSWNEKRAAKHHRRKAKAAPMKKAA